MAEDDIGARALAWIRREPETLAERIEPWEHGCVYRTDRFRRYSSLNLVRVTGDPGWGAGELASFVSRSLNGLDSLRLEFDQAATAEPLRSDLEALGFLSMRLVWMRYEGQLPLPTRDVVEVDYDAVNELRLAWQAEDYPGVDATEYLAEARQVRLCLGVRTLARFEGARPVAFAAIAPGQDEFEVAALYVDRAYRGRGLGTALTLAAIAGGGPARDVWICADDEDRPKDLYARLGFTPVLTTARFMRLPGLRLSG